MRSSPTRSSSGSSFTAAGATGGSAGFNVTAVGGFILNGGDLNAGDQASPPPGTCNLTGYDAAGDAATNGLGTAGAPLLPVRRLPGTRGWGAVTPLVSVNPNVAPAGVHRRH